jgi:putative PIN family toxin of toxin-antitoxin system
LEELEDVLHRPRIKQRFGVTETQAEELLLLITEKATPVKISGELHLCRDPRDDMLLETAIVGGATHIVSRDEDITRDLDLVEQLEKRGIKTVTVSRFLAEVGE